jgi:nucleolar pre-ribosomal-associated protein 1
MADETLIQVLMNLTCIPVAATFLVLQSSLLSWIESQLLELRADETIRWSRILENLVITVDYTKLDSSMGSGWRAALCNCLMLVLGDRVSNLLS